MKHINKSLWKLAAVCGVIVNRRNWFFMLVIPAIPGQGHCLGIMARMAAGDSSWATGGFSRHERQFHTAETPGRMDGAADS